MRYRRLNEEYEAFSKAAGLRPQRERGNIAEFGPKEAREASKAAKAFDNRTAESQRIIEKAVVNQPENGIMKLPDIQIGRSVGAKAASHNVLDPGTGEYFNFVEGSRIQNVEVFAGYGTRFPLKDEVIEGLTKEFEKLVKDPNTWQHAKGFGVLDVYGDEIGAEVHWFQADGVGRVKFKVKRWLE